MKTERQKQIEQKAEEYFGRMKKADSDVEVAFADAFRRGAQCADANPDPDAVATAYKCGKNEVIEKACDWLRGRLPLTNPDAFVERFRNAMEQ